MNNTIFLIQLSLKHSNLGAFILSNNFIDITSKANGEFKYDPKDPADKFYREELVKSHLFNHPEYYVGISCPCCEKS